MSTLSLNHMNKAIIMQRKVAVKNVHCKGYSSGVNPSPAHSSYGQATKSFYISHFLPILDYSSQRIVLELNELNIYQGFTTVI